MTLEMLLMIVACGLYAGTSVVSVRRLALGGQATERALFPLLSVAAACLAGVLLLRGLAAARVPAFGVFEALVWYALATTLAYLSLAIRHETRGFPGILLPFITVVVLASLPAIALPVKAASELQSFWLGLHIAAAFIGYGLFTVKSFLAIAYLIQDRNLKRKNFGTAFQRLPSLEALDYLMHRQIGFAFLIFSISIAFGVFLAHRFGWGSLWPTDPKVAGTAMTWLVYAVLLHLRLTTDRHGRTMALVALAGLACVLISFLGVHLVGSSVHEYIFAK